jgi:hypothetical protein
MAEGNETAGSRATRLAILIEQYAKHAALNFGQALQGLRYVHSHPDIDREAPRGSVVHLARSLGLRLRRVANDLFFATIPPHWHHTADELCGMQAVSFRRWFDYGYCAWQFTETGELKADAGAAADKRWDPRCKAPL